MAEVGMSLPYRNTHAVVAMVRWLNKYLSLVQTTTPIHLLTAWGGNAHTSILGPPPASAQCPGHLQSASIQRKGVRPA